MRLECQLIATGDKPNRNKRIYPVSVLEKVVSEFNNEILGQVGMPQSTIIHLADVSHKVTQLWMEGYNLMANIEVLDTPMGKTLQDLMKSQPVAFRMSGVGSYEEENGFIVIQESYKLASVNAIPEDDAA